MPSTSTKNTSTVALSTSTITECYSTTLVNTSDVSSLCDILIR